MTLVAADTFNRADSGTLGSTNGAGVYDPVAWSVLAGTWGITSNSGVKTAGSGQQSAVIETGVVDVDVQVTITTMTGTNSSGIGICARAVNASNYYYLLQNRLLGGGRNWFIAKLVAGVDTVLGASPYTSPAPANGDVILLRCSGSTISAYINGVLLVSVTDTSLTSGTKHGLYAIGDPAAARLDNFSVTSVFDLFTSKVVIV